MRLKIPRRNESMRIDAKREFAAWKRKQKESFLIVKFSFFWPTVCSAVEHNDKMWSQKIIRNENICIFHLLSEEADSSDDIERRETFHQFVQTYPEFTIYKINFIFLSFFEFAASVHCGLHYPCFHRKFATFVFWL